MSETNERKSAPEQYDALTRCRIEYMADANLYAPIRAGHLPPLSHTEAAAASKAYGAVLSRVFDGGTLRELLEKTANHPQLESVFPASAKEEVAAKLKDPANREWLDTRIQPTLIEPMYRGVRATVESADGKAAATPILPRPPRDCGPAR